MYEMLKTIVLDVLGIRPVPRVPAGNKWVRDACSEDRGREFKPNAEPGYFGENEARFFDDRSGLY